MSATKHSKAPTFNEKLGLPKSVDTLVTSSVDTDENGNPIVKFFYSENLPDLTYGEGKTQRAIEVNIASSQSDDEALLHKLLSKVKK